MNIYLSIDPSNYVITRALRAAGERDLRERSARAKSPPPATGTFRHLILFIRVIIMSHPARVWPRCSRAAAGPITTIETIYIYIITYIRRVL